MADDDRCVRAILVSFGSADDGESSMTRQGVEIMARVADAMGAGVVHVDLRKRPHVAVRCPFLKRRNHALPATMPSAVTVFHMHGIFVVATPSINGLDLNIYIVVVGDNKSYIDCACILYNNMVTNNYRYDNVEIMARDDQIRDAISSLIGKKVLTATKGYINRYYPFRTELIDSIYTMSVTSLEMLIGSSRNNVEILLGAGHYISSVDVMENRKSYVMMRKTPGKCLGLPRKNERINSRGSTALAFALVDDEFAAYLVADAGDPIIKDARIAVIYETAVGNHVIYRLGSPDPERFFAPLVVTSRRADGDGRHHDVVLIPERPIADLARAIGLEFDPTIRS